jgi:hypothetical protein
MSFSLKIMADQAFAEIFQEDGMKERYPEYKCRQISAAVDSLKSHRHNNPPILQRMMKRHRGMSKAGYVWVEKGVDSCVLPRSRQEKNNEESNFLHG